jgi:xylulokinase
MADWVADLAGRSIADLATEAGRVAPGADGLVVLPYFAGERSPLFDPGARGVALGLTLAHTSAHLLRAAYEAVAMGVRHNLEAFAGARPWRLVAVGGGTAARLWPQIVSDVTGRPQELPDQTIGACYGDALLAATAVGLVAEGTDWTRISQHIEPRTEYRPLYDEHYAVYRDLYTTTRPMLDRLSRQAT